MGRGHRCPQRGGISDILDVGVMRGSLRESHAPGAEPELWGKSVRVLPRPAPGEGQPCAAFCLQSRGQVGRGGGSGVGAVQGASGSPAAKSRTVQGISPPEFGQGNLAEASEAHGLPPTPPVRPEQGKENQG